MRKFLSVLLALCLVAGLTACGDTQESAASSAASTVSEAPAETTEATEAPEAAQSAAEATGSAVEAPAVMTYDEYAAAELDTQVTIEAYVQAKQSWWEDKATVYAQDQDGAYFLYDMACSEEDYQLLTPGTCIRVTGYKSEWSGEVEIIEGTFEIVEGDTFIAEPLDVTELLGKDELIDHQNQFVQFKGLTVEASQDANGEEAAFLYNYDGSGSDGDDLYFNVSYNGATYTFTVESYLCDNTTDVYKAVTALEIGQTIDAEGFLYWYEGVNPHITSITVVE